MNSLACNEGWRWKMTVQDSNAVRARQWMLALDYSIYLPGTWQTATLLPQTVNALVQQYQPVQTRDCFNDLRNTNTAVT